MHPLRHSPARTAAVAAGTHRRGCAGPRHRGRLGRCRRQHDRDGRLPGGPEGRRVPGRALRLDRQPERGHARRERRRRQDLGFAGTGGEERERHGAHDRPGGRVNWIRERQRGRAPARDRPHRGPVVEVRRASGCPSPPRTAASTSSSVGCSRRRCPRSSRSAAPSPTARPPPWPASKRWPSRVRSPPRPAARCPSCSTSRRAARRSRSKR